MHWATLLMALIVFSSVASATDYYVRTDGDNAKDGLSIANAWDTVTYAVVTGVSANDRIFVLNGTYNEGYNNIIFNDNNVTLKAYNSTSSNSQNVTINGTLTSNQNHYVITINGYDNITIEDIRIDYGGIGIYAHETNCTTIRSCTIFNSSWMGLEIAGGTGGSGSHHCLIDGCEVYQCGWNLIMFGGLTAQSGPPTSSFSSYLTLNNSEIHHGIGHNLIDFCGDMAYINITNNTLWDGDHGNFYTHQTINGTTDCWIYNNNITRGAEGFHFDGKMLDSTFSGNLIDGVGDYHVYSSVQASNLTFTHNTYVGSVAHQTTLYGTGYLFEEELGIAAYRFYEGDGNILNCENDTFIALSNGGANVTVEFTNGKKFSVDGSGEYTIYSFYAGSKSISVTGGWSPSSHAVYWNATNQIGITTNATMNIFSRTPTESDNNVTSFKLVVA